MNAATKPILLIAAGPDQHTPALQRAYDLAHASAAPVHVFVPAFDALIERTAAFVHPDVMRLAQKEFLDERALWADALAARWRDAGLAVTTEVAWTPHVAEAILDKALALRPSIVVKDVAHENVLKRLTYTALDWQLLRSCPAPLLLVSEHSAHLPRRILAAIDSPAASAADADLNDLIVAQARKHASYAGASLHLAHSFAFAPLEAAPYRSADYLYATLHHADRTAFDEYAQERGIPPDRRHWLVGNPAQQVAELAHANGVDLIVLGASPRSVLDRMLIGSTAESLLRRAPCDVLLVHPVSLAPARALEAKGQLLAQLAASRKATGMRASRR